MQTRYWMLSASLLVACASHESTIKTPDELVAEQEQLAIEQEKESQKHAPAGEAELTEGEEAKKWDKEQAELELKRAARSAETCPHSLSEEQQKNSPRETGRVTLHFNNEGHVKDATIAAPFADTPLGQCALRAMSAVIVPAYVGPQETVEWEVDLTGKKKKEE